MKLIFATNNLHKVSEIKALMPNNIQLISLSDLNFFDDIPEDKNSIEENASQKAWFVYDKFKINCFADDTGLEVAALGGHPGVFSARYAGSTKDSSKNIEKLLAELKNIDNRNARFKTIISLIIDNKEIRFEGIINGNITRNIRGNKGFGYDPVFIPEGYDITFAEMNLDEKNKISHRALAFNKLIEYLKNI
jgi:XTP/dITP diphosphohydrolase